MKKLDKFKKLMDEILESTVQEKAALKGAKIELPLVTKNILEMLIHLNQKIEEQQRYVKSIEDYTKRLEKEFKLLIKELTNSGYINLSERRKPLKRNIITLEALINHLEKQGAIDKRGFTEEIKKLSKEQKKLK